MKHSVFVMDIHKCFPCLSDPKISLFIYQGDERARTVRDGAETPTGHDGTNAMVDHLWTGGKEDLRDIQVLLETDIKADPLGAGAYWTLIPTWFVFLSAYYACLYIDLSIE